jgi:hypothetical protein
MQNLAGRCDMEYKTRVRGTIYLWGSAGILGDTTFPSPPLLHVHNDMLGEPIILGTETSGSVQTTIGTLQPGELFSIPIQGITGVFATCALETNVSCYIKSS